MNFEKSAKLVLPGLFAVGAGLAFVNCQSPDLYPCMKTAPSPSPSNASGGGIPTIVDPGLHPLLYVEQSGIWKTTAIPVCWESDTWALQTDADRAIVQKAVSETWEAALAFEYVDSSRWVHFTGWKECDDSNDSGIRITVPLNSNSAPHATALGGNLAGKSGGIVLNFDFTQWSTVCATPDSERQACIYDIAAHEFGHALGFAHEQNRPDTDRTLCTDAPQGEDGDILMGPWDESSIMNYCNPDWNNGGKLSDEDLLGVRAAYYPDLFDFQCVGQYEQRNPVPKPSLTPNL